MTAWQYWLYFVTMVFATVVMGYVSVYSWQHRKMTGGTAFAIIAFLTAFLAFVEVISMVGRTQEWALVWFDARFLPFALMPVAWLVFVLQFTGRDRWITRARVAVLLVVPMITIVMVWTNGAHGFLLKHNVGFLQAGPFLVAETGARVPGPWFIVHSAYSIVLLVFGVILLFLTAATMFRLYRRQAVLIALGCLVMVLGALVSILNLMPSVRFNPFTQSLALGAVLIALAVFRYRFLEIVPVARNLIIDSMDDAMIVLDAQGRVVDVNSKMQVLLAEASALQGGGPPVSAIGRPAEDVFRSLPEVSGIVSNGTGDTAHDTHELGVKGRPYDARVFPVKDRRGRLSWRAVLLRDITERKQAEGVLTFLAHEGGGTPGEGFFESLAQYLAQNLGADYVCIDRLEGDGLTARTVAVWCDDEFEDNVTYALKDTPCGEVVGKAVCCFPAGVRALFPLDAALQDLRAESYVGVTLWGHTGRPIGLIAVIGRRPLANRALAEAMLKLVAVRAAGELERLDAEEALRQSEEKYRVLTENMKDVVWTLDTQTLRFLYVSPSVQRLRGYTQEEILSQPMDAALTPPAAEDLKRLIHQRVADFLAGRERPDSFFTEEVEQPCKDGSTVWTEVVTSFHANERTGCVEVHGVSRDITERKRAEEERLDLERQLQQSQKLESLGVLAGGIAHDFNNILMTILGNADLALTELSPSAPARENLLEITEASRRAAELCRQMLAYSGRGHFVIEPIDLGALIVDMLNLLKSTVSKNAILNLNLEKDLPSIRGDTSQLTQVIMNLLINASEAIGETSGVITVSTGVLECSAEYLREAYEEPNLTPGLYLTLEVSDTGAGMDAETQGRLFEHFFTTKFAGRGLGLSAVIGIVRGHKGALRVESAPGRGTTFKLLFPAAEADEEPYARAIAGVGDARRGQGTILLVDDEKTIRVLGKRMLERLGYTVLSASDGREALEVYAEHGNEIALVLLDLTMPNMDGEETFRELRRANPEVRVVMSSGYSEQDITARFAGQGLVGFVPKPYTLDLLKERLQAALGSPRSK